METTTWIQRQDATEETWDRLSEDGGRGYVSKYAGISGFNWQATRGGAMLITGKVKLTKPAEEPMEAMLFATPEGNLVADDPHQQKLDLKSVPGATDTPVTQLKTA